MQHIQKLCCKSNNQKRENLTQKEKIWQELKFATHEILNEIQIINIGISSIIGLPAKNHSILQAQVHLTFKLSKSAPELCNSLPQSLRDITSLDQFKSRLMKTFLFLNE